MNEIHEFSDQAYNYFFIDLKLLIFATNNRF